MREHKNVRTIGLTKISITGSNEQKHTERGRGNRRKSQEDRLLGDNIMAKKLYLVSGSHRSQRAEKCPKNVSWQLAGVQLLHLCEYAKGSIFAEKCRSKGMCQEHVFTTCFSYRV